MQLGQGELVEGPWDAAGGPFTWRVSGLAQGDREIDCQCYFKRK